MGARLFVCIITLNPSHSLDSPSTGIAPTPPVPTPSPAPTPRAASTGSSFFKDSSNMEGFYSYESVHAPTAPLPATVFLWLYEKVGARSRMLF